MWVYKPVVDAHPRQSGPLYASTCVHLPTQMDTRCEWETEMQLSTKAQDVDTRCVPAGRQAHVPGLCAPISM